MLTGLKVSSLARKCVFYRSVHETNERGTPWNFILKYLKCKNEIKQLIDLK